MSALNSPRYEPYTGTAIAADGKRYPVVAHDIPVVVNPPLLPDNGPLEGTKISSNGQRIPSTDALILQRLPSFPEHGRV